MPELVPGKLLIVDDDPSLGKSLQRILEKKGFKTDLTASGKGALAMVQDGQSNDLNVVLIDVGLPDMNGIELLREIKRRDPDMGVLMMTGNSDLNTAIKALNDGAFAYIQKPYNVDEVKSLIEKILEKQRLVRENKVLLERLKQWNAELAQTVKEKTAELETKNITLLEMIEKLKVLNESKSKFVANASHELQTPMTSILGFSSMLLQYWDKIDKSQVMRFLEIIRDETQRLTRLSQDLLNLSKIQEGRMNLKIEKIDLQAIAESVRENMKMVKASVRIDLDIDVNARYIVSDRDKIHQIFTNLVGNALKYSPDNSRVDVRAREKGAIVVVEILDEGPGIPDDRREKIFEPFYRIKDDIGEKVRGTGLGLSIAKAIVEALGGVIRVEARPEKGSNFTFVLPKEAYRKQGAEDGKQEK